MRYHISLDVHNPYIGLNGSGSVLPLTSKSRFSTYSDNMWLNLLVNPRGDIPPLPSKEIQLMITGMYGLQTMQQAFAFYDTIRKFSSELYKPLSSMGAIMDFGCGWGRIIRCFLRDVEPEVLNGCDCLPYMIQLCKKDLPECKFIQNEPLPPTPFGANTFDMIYAYSVFSHLSEQAHKAWLAEFHRLLKLGGILVLTTRQRDFIPTMPLMPQISKINIKKSLQEYDAGKFIHTPIEGESPLEGFYGETAIPEAYIRKEWLKWFSLKRFLSGIPHIDQNIILLTKEVK